jgi:hypothetical protein
MPNFSSRIVRAVAGGWQMAPIISVHTGSYFTVTTGVDNALNNIAGQRPNQTAINPYCPNQGPNCWINASAFAAPDPGTLGSSGANSLLGPALLQVDVSVSRRFTLVEHHTLEFRADFFNVPNTVNFSIPVTTPLTSANFGKITSDITAPGSASGDPRIIQLSLKYAF